MTSTHADVTRQLTQPIDGYTVTNLHRSQANDLSVRELSSPLQCPDNGEVKNSPSRHVHVQCPLVSTLFTRENSCSTGAVSLQVPTLSSDSTGTPAVAMSSSQPNSHPVTSTRSHDCLSLQDLGDNQLDTNSFGSHDLSPLMVGSVTCPNSSSSSSNRTQHISTLTSVSSDSDTETQSSQCDDSILRVLGLDSWDALALSQRNSPDIHAIITYLKNDVVPSDAKLANLVVHNPDAWVMEGNILFHLYEPRKRNINSLKPIVKQVVIPVPLRSEVMRHYHDNLAHFRLDKTYATLQQVAYWPGMYIALATYIKNCETCAIANQRPPGRVKLQHPEVGLPFDTLVIDHLSLPAAVDPLTQQTVSYCLTLVDRATQWTVLVPVPDCTAKVTALCVVRYWISNFGLMKNIYSDLGPAYTSNLFAEICRILDIKHDFAASQNHKAVSRAETANRLVVNALRRVCATTSDWPSCLPGVALALHASVVTSIGLTPAYMMYHRELTLPGVSVPQNCDKMLSQLVDTVALTDEIIKQNTEASFAQADQHYNKTAYTPTFTVNQRVYLYDEYIPIGVMRKLHKFYRPVFIEAVLPNYCYRVRDEKSGRLLPFKVHASRLKRAVNTLPQHANASAVQMHDLATAPTEIHTLPVPTTSNRCDGQEDVTQSRQRQQIIQSRRPQPNTPRSSDKTITNVHVSLAQRILYHRALTPLGSRLQA